MYHFDVNPKERECLKKEVSEFHLACIKNDTVAILAFINQGNIELINSTIKVPYPEYHFLSLSALHIAVENNNMEVIESLLNAGAQINQNSEDGTPLYMAVSIDLPEIFQYLLNRGADINITVQDNENLFHHFLEIIAFDMVHKSCEEWIRRLFEAGCNINHQNSFGNPPIVYAPLHVYDIMFELGADVNIVNNDKRIALFNDFDLINTFPQNIYCYNVYTHIQKLKFVRLEIHDQVEDLSNKIILNVQRIDPSGQYFTPNRLDVRNYFDDLEQLEQLVISNKNMVTVKSIMLMSVHDMMSYINNTELLNLYNSKDLERRFPSFGALLKIKFKAAQERKILLETVIESFYEIICVKIPNLHCVEEILRYFNSTELNLLIL